MKTVLTVAGFDPSSGAGVTADLLVFAAHGLFGTSCITALTVQSTIGVGAVHPIAAEVVAETLRCLEEDLPADGVKIGMLGTSDNVDAVARYIETLRARAGGLAVPVVLDPVIRASSGAGLLDEAGLEVLKRRLLPLVDWVTPNVPELEALTGRKVSCAGEVPEACRELQESVRAVGRAAGVFAKGGHLDRPDDYLLGPDGDGVWIPGERISTRSTHGTGCALSSAFLSQLVLRTGATEAATEAKRYVAGALEHAVAGLGRGHGPLNHLWRMAR